jgi:hypothetical protein
MQVNATLTGTTTIAAQQTTDIATRTNQNAPATTTGENGFQVLRGAAAGVFGAIGMTGTAQALSSAGGTGQQASTSGGSAR